MRDQSSTGCGDSYYEPVVNVGSVKAAPIKRLKMDSEGPEWFMDNNDGLYLGAAR